MDAQQMLTRLKHRIDRHLKDSDNSEHFDVTWHDPEHNNPNEDPVYLRNFCEVLVVLVVVMVVVRVFVTVVVMMVDTMAVMVVVTMVFMAVVTFFCSGGPIIHASCCLQRFSSYNNE